MPISRNSKKYFMRNDNPGHSTVEYALPLAIIGLVVLLGVGAMTPLFSGFVGKSLGQNDNAATTSPPRTIQVQKLGSNPLVQPAVLTLSDGTKIQLSQFPTNLKQSVESVGANGTTDLLANVLKELALKLKEAGKIDVIQFQNLIDLANHGHQLGKLEGQVEDVLKEPNFSQEAFRQKTIDYHGQPLSVANFSLLLGANTSKDSSALKWHQQNPNSRILTQEEKTLNNTFLGGLVEHYPTDVHVIFGPDRYNFLKQFIKTNDSLASGDGNVLALFRSLSFNINSISQLTGTATNTLITDSKENDKGISVTSPEEFKAFIAKGASDTHINSSGLCLLGKGKDIDEHCH
jgi:hypothetical protein